MPDLFEGSERPFFRISELAACDLVIGHRIIGTTQHDRNMLPLWVGTALESVINNFLRSHGLTIIFGDQDQLTVSGADPYRMGHPDGLIFLKRGDTLSPWARRNLPIAAQERLNRGEVLLLEDKTMNDTSWKQFVSQGLKGGVFLAKYLLQIQGYLQTLGDLEAAREIWEPAEIDRYLEALNTYELEPPTAALVVGYNTATKSERSFAFELVEYNPAALHERLVELEHVSAMLHAGNLPMPSYDGRAPECYSCSFSNVCPATKKLIAESQDFLLDVSTADHVDVEELERALDGYIANREAMAALKVEQADLRAAIEGMLLDGTPVQTERYRARMSEVSGRETIDMHALEAIAEAFGFMIPKRRGQGHTWLYITTLYGPTYDGRD